MGLVRLLLAVAVIVGHTQPIFGLKPIDPARAVQAFYVISGFYMGMVLGSKYDNKSLGGLLLFYRNRYFRLAPTYWVVLAGSVAGAFAMGAGKWETLRKIGDLSPGSALAAIAANLLIFGQDVFMFLGVDFNAGEHSLRFAPFLTSTSFPATRLMVIAPAWTLGVELTYYLVAPFLSRLRTRYLLGVGTGSLLCRALLYRAGYSADPWSYRFFPNELVFFVAGMLLFRLYQRGFVQRLPRWSKITAWVLVLGLSLVIESLGPLRDAGYLVFLVAMLGGLPMVFDLTRKMAWDARLAELSYPVYIVHYTVMQVIPAGQLKAVFTTIASILAALVLIRFVERPIDRLRQRAVSAKRLDGAPASGRAARPSRAA